MKRITGILLSGMLLFALPLACSAQSAALAGGDYLYEATAEKTIKITRYTGSAAEPEIPGMLGGYRVTQIGENAFRDCGFLKKVRIPEGVGRIGDQSFYNCTALAELSLPYSLREIGDLAFAYCSALETLSIPQGMVSIGEYAFGDCSALRQASLPDSVTFIGSEAFAGTHPDFILYCGMESYARNYAAGNGLSFGNLAGINVENVPEIALQGEELETASLPAETFVGPMDITLPFPFGSRAGTYTGGMREGLPQGSGSFMSVNSEGVSWTYTGSWDKGDMHGQGGTVWEDGLEKRGRYERGLLIWGQELYRGIVVYDGDFCWDDAAKMDLYHGEGILYNVLGKPIYAGGFASGRLAESPESRAIRAGALMAQCMPLTPGDYRAILEDEAGWLGRMVRFDGDIPYIWDADESGTCEFEQSLNSDDTLPVDVYCRYSQGERVIELNEAVTTLGAVTGVYRYEYEGISYAMPLVEAELILRADEQSMIDTAGQEVHTDDTSTDTTPMTIGIDDAAETSRASQWPIENLAVYDLKAVDKGDQRAMAYCGPGKEYREAGAFKTNKLTKVKGVLIENDYVLVDMDYTGVGKRWVYFRKSAFKNASSVPPRTLIGFDAVTLADFPLRFGPGYEYDDFDEEVLAGGSQISVFFEERGWVFAEFMTSQGLARGWLEASAVRGTNR